MIFKEPRNRRVGFRDPPSPTPKAGLLGPRPRRLGKLKFFFFGASGSELLYFVIYICRHIYIYVYICMYSFIYVEVCM